MRIAVVTHSLDVIGGVETYLRRLLPALSRRGNELIVIYAASQSGSKILDETEVTAWSLDQGPRQVFQRLADWCPDLVFHHSIQCRELNELLVHAHPIVFFAHAYFGTCISGAKSVRLPSRRPCDRVLGPGCLLRYLPLGCGGRNPLRAWQGFRESKQDLAWLNGCGSLIVASEHMRREYLAHGIPATRIHVISYPLADKELYFRVDRSQGGVLAFAGRIEPTKGCEYFIRAVSKLNRLSGRDYQIRVLGDGSYRKRIEVLARRESVRIDFRGWVKDLDMHLEDDVDAVVVPSLWPEPFGMVGIEAGAVGIPVVAYCVGGIPDWLTPGVNGELASGSPPTVDGLVQAMWQVLESSDRWQEYRAASFRHSKRFTMDRHLSGLESVFSNAVARRVPEEPASPR